MNVSYDITATLRANMKHHEPIVLIYDARGNGCGTISATITGDHENRVTDYTALVIERPTVTTSIVRRLTPTECSRLQGFPDKWLDIGDYTDENGRTRKEADTAKYKAAGNSIALPFWAWLFRRINTQYERQATMGSLFDGIGGFPLTALRNGIKPLWASEIEAFPIAVVKKHFGDEDAGTEGDVWMFL